MARLQYVTEGRKKAIDTGTFKRAAPVEQDDYRWLVSAEALPWLERAATAETSIVKLTAALRRELSIARTHLVLEQVALRERARRKFPAAQRMFFTARALEQATDWFVAAYKARRFPATAPVADLCCGIGGDLVALAGRGATVGVERDPLLAILAEANVLAVNAETVAAPSPPAPLPPGERGERRDVLAPGERGETRDVPREGRSVVVEDVASFAVRDFGAWHIDPDRRVGGRRSTRVELHEPGPEVIEQLRSQQQAGAVKLAPAATLPEAWHDEAELEWISRDGECRQLVCWFGALASAVGQRRATILDHRTGDARSIVGQDGEIPRAEILGEYLFEPDAAVLAAHLTAALAAEHGLAAPSPGVAYLTGAQRIADPALACFRVQEIFPLDIRQLRAALSARLIGRLEIKKRGVDCDPEKLRRDLKLHGDQPGTLIVMPLDGQTKAILAERA